MNKYMPFFLCLLLASIITISTRSAPNPNHINTYPNLPAPIGEERILITSAGQAPESTIISNIADNLNLEMDYRPRALATDLYDYQSLIIVIGFSANGMLHTPRSLSDELKRTKQLVEEAAIQDVPIILVNLVGKHREDPNSMKLFQAAVPYANYYIGIKQMENKENVLATLRSYKIPATLVHQLKDISVPLNSAFR
ncbi:DUF6305 family protein [Virgibacillus salexigens]|uniref:DUF6305 family protein n=1 Tax=Virgibacillus salexigens TaxID=61016 RepID=UPI00190B5B9F|nr:DUF6305 family protein [Virgibacillus salexigens]